MKILKQTWTNYHLPTPNKWRKRGDWSLIASMIILIFDFAIETIQNAPGLTENQIYYWAKLLSLFLIIFKFWSNTHVEKDNNDIDSSIT